MALTSSALPAPPLPQQRVDDDKPGGVNFSWHEWFTRLWNFVQDLLARIIALETAPVVVTNSMVPYFIAVGDTFTVPIYKQAPFAITIDNQGVLIVDGFLIQVD